MSYFRTLLEKATRVNRVNSRKLVTALAAVVVAVSPLVGVTSPASAAVDCNALFAGGAGTSGDPWKVSTAAQFSSVRDCGATTGTYFDQMNDISLASYSYWIPIARILGTYNGHNFKISDLKISSGSDWAALISYTSRESHITGVNVVVNSVYGKTGTAGLVSQHMGRITSSSVSGGTVTSTGTYVGALVAINDGSIENSWASNNVSATGGAVGGLVGVNEDGVITNSYARGNVSAGYNAGGLVGWNYVYNSDPSITNSYSTGSVSASTQAGGILGYSNNNGGYAGAAVPFSGKSFWDTVTSGKSIYGTNNPVVALTTVVGKTTSEMKSYATFGPTGGNWKITNGWDVYDSTNKIWGICPGVNDGYPFLLWQDPTGTGCGFPGPPTTATATVGGTTATVSWAAPANSGSSDVTGYTVTSSVGSKTCSATALERSCTVTGLTTGQAYTFTVTATNTSGTGSASNAVTVTPMEVPVEVIDGAPSSTKGVGSATVTWTNKVSSNVTGYLVTASPSGASCTAPTSALSAPSCVVSGLTNGTAYTFTVKTTNAAGASLTASSVSNAVIPLSVPGSPGTPAVSSPADSEVTLTWTAPSDIGGSAVTEYTATSSPGSLTCVVSGLTCTIIGLTNGTSYSFSVKAKNSEGYGLASAVSFSAIPRKTPGVPTAVTVLAPVRDAHAVVEWVAPVSTGGVPITEYQVRAYDSDGVSRGLCTTILPAALSCDVTGLTNGVAYRFGVFAYNSSGYGSRSTLSSLATPMSKPGLPTAIQVLAGDESVLVTWMPPTDTGGSSLTSYTATSSPGGHTCTANAPSTICFVPGLTNGVAYTFTVTARSAAFATVGQSDPSSASVSVTPRTVPSAPVVSTLTPGNGEFVVGFTPPSSDGGDSITGYEYSRDSGLTWHPTSSGGTSSPQRISGLTTSTTYSILLRAVNGAGEGVASNAMSGTFVSAPGAPTSVTGVAGNNGVALSWTAPVFTGGRTLVSYTATASPGGASCTVLVPASSCDVTGLTNGVNYTFAVTATNNIGTGVASASSVVMKPLSPGVSETTFEITITVSVGDPVAGGTAEFASSGLEPGTPWSLIVRSTPRLLSSGAAGAAGTILGNAVIPSGLGEGWHSLTLTGRDYLGRDASSTTWFQVNAAGELVGSSHVDPTVSSGLASTGRDVALPFQAAILLILLGGVLTRLTRKRNSRG